jgi:hypothetical protein
MATWLEVEVEMADVGWDCEVSTVPGAGDVAGNVVVVVMEDASGEVGTSPEAEESEDELELDIPGDGLVERLVGGVKLVGVGEDAGDVVSFTIPVVPVEEVRVEVGEVGLSGVLDVDVALLVPDEGVDSTTDVDVVVSEGVETVDRPRLLEGEVEMPDGPVLWSVEALVRTAGGGITMRLRVVEVVNVVCSPFNGVDSEVAPVVVWMMLEVAVGSRV